MSDFYSYVYRMVLLALAGLTLAIITALLLLMAVVLVVLAPVLAFCYPNFKLPTSFDGFLHEFD